MLDRELRRWNGVPNLTVSNRSLTECSIFADDALILSEVGSDGYDDAPGELCHLPYTPLVLKILHGGKDELWEAVKNETRAGLFGQPAPMEIHTS